MYPIVLNSIIQHEVINGYNNYNKNNKSCYEVHEISTYNDIIYSIKKDVNFKANLLQLVYLCKGYYANFIFFALGPFSPSTTSNVTLAPSWSSSNVTPTKSFEWKKRSLASPSREINPNPL